MPPPTSNQRRRPSPWVLILLLALLQSVTPLSVDLYLPALPTIARGLHSGQGPLNLTLSGFMIGFAVGQLFWGPVGDRFGRKVPMVLGLVLYVAASAGCAMATDVWALVAWRIVQALGGCALPVLGSAMVRDCFDREEGARVRSLMQMVGAVAPMVAPLIGGQLMLIGSWRLMFWVLAAFGAFSLLAALALTETLTAEARRDLHPVSMVRGYGELLTDRAYLAWVLPAGLTGAGMFAYISGTPFVYIDYFHVPPQAYGLLFGLNMLGMVGASALNSAFVRRLGPDRLFTIGCAIVCVAGLALATIGISGFGGLPALAAAIFVYVSTMGPNSANAAAGALAGFPHKAGSAAALMGFLSMGLGSLAGALVGVFADGTPRPMCIIMGVIGVAALASYGLLARPRSGALAAG